MRRADPLHPIHISRAGKPRQPLSMERLDVSADASELLERESLSIFTDMTNAGWPFQKALAAIYLTGMHVAAEAAAQPKE